LPGIPKSEYLNPRRFDGCVLKKQTQFFEGKIGVNYYLKGDYDNIPPCGARKNKANLNPQTCAGGLNEQRGAQ
jgi:hypothetical protein